MISGILALCIAGICVAGIWYVNLASDHVEQNLQTCIDHAENDDFEQAKAALRATGAVWEKERTVLMMYTDQEILDEIDDHLAHMEALADHHKDEFVPTAVLCLGKLKELRQRENLSLYSWF